MSVPLAVPVQGPVSMRVAFSGQSAAEVRYALYRWLGYSGAGESVIDDALLVITELLGNAVRHATPLVDGTVLVRWCRDEAGLLLSVSDGGGRTAPALAGAEALEERGRGLALVAALSLRWWVDSRMRAHTVHARLPLA